MCVYLYLWCVIEGLKGGGRGRRGGDKQILVTYEWGKKGRWGKTTTQRYIVLPVS